AALQNTLLSLVVNARDAIGAGAGTVHVRVAQRAPRVDEFDADPGGTRLTTLTVADDGVGMPPDVLARATEPLFTTKEPGLGTGLGLSMVQKSMREAGGWLRIDSSPGKGTVVELVFPELAEPTDERPASSPPVALRRMAKILLVDDEPALLRATARGLKGLGYGVVAASSPREALSRVEDDPTLTVLVTDIVMPATIDGIELARRVLARRPGLPVVFVTGFATVAAEGEATNLGTLVLKPFALRDLAKAVDEAVERASAKATAG
ncbi:MAG: ATP-binding protein, partial [Myxococcota bacterium]